MTLNIDQVVISDTTSITVQDFLKKHDWSINSAKTIRLAIRDAAKKSSKIHSNQKR